MRTFTTKNVFFATVVVVLAAMSFQVVAEAQTGYCAEFKIDDNGYCVFEKAPTTMELSAVELGDIYLSANNTGSAVPTDAQFYWSVQPTTDERTAGMWGTLVLAYRWTSDGKLVVQGPVEGDFGIHLLPANSWALQLRFAAGCDTHGQNCVSVLCDAAGKNCIPQPDNTKKATVVVTVGWKATTPEALRGLTLPSVVRLRIY